MKAGHAKSGERGYALLALMLMVTLIMIGLAVEAPRIAQQIKREREIELEHRGKDYATAIKRFVHKNGGRFPTSIDQLENTNHIRFLRKRYKDPITGEDNWHIVHFGEAQVKIPAPNPGLSNSGNPGLSGGNALTQSNTPGLPGQSNIAPPPNNTAPLLNSTGGQLGQGQPQPGGTGQLGTLRTTNIGNGQTVGGGQIIGVASVSKGVGIKEFNEKTHYDEWLFVYDLRLEQAGGTGVTVGSPRGDSGSGDPQQGQLPGQPQAPSAAPSPVGTPPPQPN